MSTGARGMDVKMARSNGFVGTLKRLFKYSHRSEEGTKVVDATFPGGIATKTAPCIASEAERNSIDSQLPQAFGGGAPFASPFPSRKSYDRPLMSSNSGPLVSTFPRSVSVAQASLHHSISDACEKPSVQATSEQPKQLQGHQGRGLRGSPLCARSDASLRCLYDSTGRSSQDIQTVATSLPSVVGGFPKPPKPFATVSLPSVDSPHPPRMSGSAIPQPSEAPVDPLSFSHTPPNTSLLALCPGVPAAMRRRHWSLEDYEVTRRIYKGSTSAVYKATCRRSGLPVALKVYCLSRVPPNVIHMIVREIKIHVELVHKHIAMLYGAFQDEKRLVLVQEYAGRGDLYGIYRSLDHRMSEAQLTHLVLTPFAEALTYLHSRGICHRDVKPENILFTNDWRLLVADFGVSIDLNQERAVTRAGTLEYMAPEVERCPLKMLPEENKEKLDLAYTTAVDIWATGVLAYELLVGFPPFVVDKAAASNGPGSASSGTPSPGGMFLAEYATRKTLSFPASTSAYARDFISLALAERAEERPTALQLSRHPWVSVANQQPPPRRSFGQLNSLSVTTIYPSRLGSTSLASAPNTSTVPMAALVL